jgi:hypothetical protein
MHEAGDPGAEIGTIVSSIESLPLSTPVRSSTPKRIRASG